MKVTGQNLNRTVGSTNQPLNSDRLVSQNKTQGAEKARLGSSSKVEVSAEAQALAKAKEIASLSSVDEAKVARLQSLIDSGQYKVDAKAIADRMVDEFTSMPE